MRPGAVTLISVSPPTPPPAEGRAARLPPDVLALPFPQQIGWLDSEAACALFKRKTRQRLRRNLVAQIAALSGQSSPPTTSFPTPDPSGDADDPTTTVTPLRANALARRGAKRGSFAGTTPCRCQYCVNQSALWPPYYVSRWLTGLASIVHRKHRRPLLSWECYLERNPPADPPPSPPMTEAEAERARLTVKKKNAKKNSPRPPLVSGCASCGGNRPKGNKFCRKCEKDVRKQMQCDGYFTPSEM